LALSPKVERFIAEYIHSVEQLEVLLLLYGSPSRAWTVAEVVAELRTAASSAVSRLEDLTVRGLVVKAPGLEPTFTYGGPRTPELDATIALVRETYAQRRIAVISAIFSKPLDAVDGGSRTKGQDRT
jgi:hypothetical protein